MLDTKVNAIDTKLSSTKRLVPKMQEAFQKNTFKKKIETFDKKIPKSIVTRNEQFGKAGRLNRNLYVMLKFTERSKTTGMTSKQCFP